MGDRITTYRDCPKCGGKGTFECYEALSSNIKMDECEKCGYTVNYDFEETDDGVLITKVAPQDQTQAEEQNRYWQEQFKAILMDGDALDVGYGIPYLFAQIAPIAKTREEHDRQTRKMTALARAIDSYCSQRIEEEVAKRTPVTIMGKTIEEVFVILSALELERIADMTMTMSRLDDWMKLVREDHHKAMQKAINRSFKDALSQGTEKP